ncbi:nitroreductase family protein [Lacrimispora sp. 38-1]|uniref:nitroreductase family protein n=1 Tax=Lacrimispora sp. 38-1 TaxID=3125778 RepID=UPI003CF0842C
MNETMYTLLHRRSVRKYKQDEIDRETVEQILQAGLYAANGGNNQVPRFIALIGQEQVETFAHLVCSEMGKLDEAEYPYQKNHIRNAKQNPSYDCCYGAPVLILVVAPIDHGNSMADCACATQNMLNAAYSLGLGSCYMNQPHWVTDKEAIRQAMIGFGMHEDEQIYCGLIVGYAMSTIDAMPARKEGRVCILQN